MSRVLIVEDEKDIQDLLALHFKRDGLVVEIATNGQSAWDKLQLESFALVVMDWMLPGDLAGLELTRLIRAHKKWNSMPILMVTARASDADIIQGLEHGADDYVTKPFEVSVLMARVRALFRRFRQSGDLFRLEGLELSLDSHVVRLNGRPLELTPYEFKLLLALMKNAGKVLTRDQLIEEVQGSGVTVVDRAIDTHIFGLRKKLGKDFNAIESVRGVGYRISPPNEG